MSFEPVEDRVLLKLDTTDASRFQFWLTRRYVKLLWPVLLELLLKDERIAVRRRPQARHEPSPPRAAPQADDAPAAAPQAPATAPQAPATAPQAPAAAYPLGATPVLLSRITLKTTERGRALSILPERGKGVDLALDQSMLHSMCKLLRDVAAKADWGLTLDKDFPIAALGARLPKTKLN